MNKLDVKKIDKKVLNQCKEIALANKYIISPIRVYENIRNEFCIGNDVNYIAGLGIL